MSTAFNLKPIEYTAIQDGIKALCQNILFRQSMIKSYMVCPQMAMYESIIKLTESTPWLAAVLGTAGHKVMYDAHEIRNFKLSYAEIAQQFSDAFREELSTLSKLPQIGKFDSIDENLKAKMPEYVQMLLGYMAHKSNSSFHSIMHEQYFVLPISVPELSDKPFIFTGQIDQAGYNDEGQLILRDIKFRDNQFRPDFYNLSLDVQFTIYAYALKHGVPACNECRPKYDQIDYSLIYNGPCKNCQAMIGQANRWPQRYPVRCELVWMRDFYRRTEDEYKKYIKDPQKLKTINPTTGRSVIRDVINPKWVEGYKAGDYSGKGLYTTVRPPAALQVLMSDVLRTANSIRNAVFYRNPSKDKCGYWCKFKEECIAQKEIEMENHDITQIEAGVAIVNPFEDMV